jgi:hypothetical protein
MTRQIRIISVLAVVGLSAVFAAKYYCDRDIPFVVDSSRYIARQMLIRDFGPPKATFAGSYGDILQRFLHGRSERATQRLQVLYPGTDVHRLPVEVLSWHGRCAINARRLVAVVDSRSGRVIDIFTSFTFQ